jgi:hypothetical protein
MSMQMDAYLKMEQIGALLVWVGALEGGLGGLVPQGCPPQKVNVSSKKKHPPVSKATFRSRNG